MWERVRFRTMILELARNRVPSFLEGADGLRCGSSTAGRFPVVTNAILLLGAWTLNVNRQGTSGAHDTHLHSPAREMRVLDPC